MHISFQKRNKGINSQQNAVLVDWDSPENWDFIDELEKKTKKKWIVLKYISNKNFGNLFQKITRYVKYFYGPFIVFFRRTDYRYIVAWQQFYGLVFALYCRLFHVKNAPEIIILTFIYKEKKNLIGKIYYKFIYYVVHCKQIKKIIVNSNSEKEYYRKLFHLDWRVLEMINFGEKDMTEEIPSTVGGEYFLSAGRSNRDYDFLLDFWDDKKDNLIIISDETKKVSENKNTQILDKCYDNDYFKKIANSYAVIIPLKDINISSGQLVIIHSMMYGKPCIVTFNHTVSDYIIDGYNGLIINKTKEALQEAIKKIKDTELYSRMSQNARLCYQEKYSIHAMGEAVGNILVNLTK